MSGLDRAQEPAIVPLGALSLGPDLVPTAGVWHRSNEADVFTPRFPPAPGGVFVVLAGPPWSELARVAIPATVRRPTTSVVAIETDVDVVPANLLRFAVTFSGPMDEGSAAGRVHLLDTDGAEIDGALMEMPPELWSRDRRRLTLLLEPGRIKRGLVPHLEAGAPLHEGASVTLVVDDALLDSAGAPLVESARRTFLVGPEIRSRVDPGRWRVTWPDREQEPVIVAFDRPLDRVLVQRHLQALDAGGEPVAGSVVAAPAGWSFTPDAGGRVAAVRVDALLEDLAGNSVRRVFDRDLASPADDSLAAPFVELRPPA
ncbi:hypothetical protein [Frondihabitans australicus]|uniref:Uncharacterized protein n=1 Tax=Frondihabitans australicus TaxID=386892 RepID=A0A495IJR2_9MICO|nr:hypothetical protein [Frondihabitans australicus]RKR75960.1 hypothetical protein C8E83_3124 [Frondihabitans australicus]